MLKTIMIVFAIALIPVCIYFIVRSPEMDPAIMRTKLASTQDPFEDEIEMEVFLTMEESEECKTYAEQYKASCLSNETDGCDELVEAMEEKCFKNIN